MNYTHKDQFGRNARVIAQDVAGRLNVALAVQIAEHEEQVVLATQAVEDKNSYLAPWSTVNPSLGFKPYNPWEEVAIDTPVWVRNINAVSWIPRHFAGMRERKPVTWAAGKTSHTSQTNQVNEYDFVQLENPNGN